MPRKLHWTDVEDLALELLDANPQADPMTMRFTELRRLVAALPDFEEKPGLDVNEKILEAIQAAWIEEKSGAAKDDDE